MEDILKDFWVEAFPDKDLPDEVFPLVLSDIRQKLDKFQKGDPGITLIR